MKSLETNLTSYMYGVTVGEFLALIYIFFCAPTNYNYWDQMTKFFPGTNEVEHSLLLLFEIIKPSFWYKIASR